MPGNLASHAIHYVLETAAIEQKDVLIDADATVTDPDYCSGESLACYSGNPLFERHVMVDYLGNAVHVRRTGGTSFADERLVITYLPSWFYAVLRKHLPVDPDKPLRPRNHEVCLSAPVDRNDAVPIEVTAEVVTAPWRGWRGVCLPQVRYDIDPSEPAAALRRGSPAATDPTGRTPPEAADVERVHWLAPRLRVVAAPGVRITTRYLYPTIGETHLASPVEQIADLPWGETVMIAARQADDLARARMIPVSTCDQALSLQIERVQDPAVLPRLGGARRDTGIAEADLLAADRRVRRGVRFEETTRPDGVDLDLFTAKASATAAAAPLDLLSVVQGRITDFQPVPVRIRVDPGSETDRFAYSICYLDDNRKPVADAGQAARSGPHFRLSVVRTPSTQVYVAALLSPAGLDEVRQLVEYRELIVPELSKVPATITDNGESLTVNPDGLERRPLTLGDAVDAAQLAIGLIPFPLCQVASDLADYATLLSYLASGKDLIGREMTPLDAALTLGGLFLPEVLEPLGGQLGRLLARPGVVDRLRAGLGAVDPAVLHGAQEPLRALKAAGVAP